MTCHSEWIALYLGRARAPLGGLGVAVVLAEEDLRVVAHLLKLRQDRRELRVAHQPRRVEVALEHAAVPRALQRRERHAQRVPRGAAVARRRRGGEGRGGAVSPSSSERGVV